MRREMGARRGRREKVAPGAGFSSLSAAIKGDDDEAARLAKRAAIAAGWGGFSGGSRR